MGFEISLVKKIKAKKEFVFDWWTDLSPDDPGMVKPLKSRQVISKTPTLILLRDEEEMYYKRMSFEVKVTLERPTRWISEYEGKEATARSEYTLSSQDDGSTILTYHTRIEPHGRLTKMFSPIIRYFVKRVFEGELKTFILTLEGDYKAKQTIRKER